VAFDANNDVYVLAQQTNTANTAGELILTKFDFSGDTPVVVPYQQPVTHTVNDYQIVREYIGDPLFNPTMAVDDNLATYSDPVTNVAQNDPYSGNVYIAWNTDETAPTGATNWNPNSIQMVSSSDSGQIFSNPLRMNVAGNYNGGTYGTQRETTPRLVVSQGRAPGTGGPNDPGVPGGQVTAVWDNYGNYGDGLDRLMSNRVTNGSVTDLESKVYPAPVTLSGIATDLPQLIPLAGTTRTTSTITLNSFPAGYLIRNIQVTIGDLQYSPVGPLMIKLIAPDGTSDILFQTPNDYGGSNFENTVFTDSATTCIILGTAPYPGQFQPFSPLGTLNSLPANGKYSLEIDAPHAPPTGQLNSWSITVTAASSSGSGIISSPPANAPPLDYLHPEHQSDDIPKLHRAQGSDRDAQCEPEQCEQSLRRPDRAKRCNSTLFLGQASAVSIGYYGEQPGPRHL